MSKAFPREPLPKDLNRLVGHVLYEWRDRPRRGEVDYPHTENIRMRHTWDSKRDISKFDKSWSDQNIVDAIVATLETPDYALSGKVKRVVWKDIHGTTVRMSYNVLPDGRGLYRTRHTAIPQIGRRKELLSSKEVYARLDAILPSSVDREDAESNLNAGEIEYAITALLDDAYTSVGLSDAVVSLIRDNYDDGPVIDMLDALLYYQSVKSV
ncbi:hypothetical protein ACQXY3_10520 [Corynebacterium diphtheriae]|uniref:hypothetical protein n=1 Tax=Corynebacterium diphtheriae TaxID=1717 RepID=UPI000245B168|nr:hypothetical protein [Corynebacterium diphtheriae]AEX42922.1 hypothetical protein CD31A_2257 [Corynebacterium diphtheriae 31A]AEX49727.1 hypothetical protein CDBH8_2213 [Corynebacterium diphtheriae BH8]CAB0620489.1 hypothetical protein CIP107550_02238 [Corynebacterium diphtheriae]CAB0742693.1 hypothetical protein FRC0088_02219 [Corynebacterium diphtheriae]